MIEIESKSGATQFIDFNGMEVSDTGYPTDIDGFIEYHDKCHIFIELKYKNTELKKGQAMAYYRLCDDLQKVKPTLLIIAEHCVGSGEIVMANTVVRRYRYKGEWRYPIEFEGLKTIDLVTDFIHFVDGRRYTRGWKC
jgi:hypothetical protein